MKLDAQTKKLLDDINIQKFPQIETIPLAVLRARKSFFGYESLATIKKVKNIFISGPAGEIQLRIYTPNSNGLLPVFVTFHGGGWVLGSLDSYDGVCRDLCNQAECIVVSVDYHLAPEYKFPVPLIDCYVATEWVFQNIALYNGNPEKIVIGGVSAGGNLAACVALMAKDKQSFFLSAQILICPFLDCNFSTESHMIYQSGYFLTLSQCKWFLSLYVKDEIEAFNPYVSPMRSISLKGLPQALVVIAEFDPLRDDGVFYAQKLLKDCVSVETKIYPTIHGFISCADRLDIGKKGIKDIANYLLKIFE